jgi:hypothetical protein
MKRRSSEALSHPHPGGNRRVGTLVAAALIVVLARATPSKDNPP